MQRILETLQHPEFAGACAEIVPRQERSQQEKGAEARDDGWLLPELPDDELDISAIAFQGEIQNIFQPVGLLGGGGRLRVLKGSAALNESRRDTSKRMERKSQTLTSQRSCSLFSPPGEMFCSH